MKSYIFRVVVEPDPKDDGTDGRHVIVAYHCLGNISAPGTLSTILKETRWTDEDLQRLGLISH
jgi:hypothetical protein